MRLLLIAVPLLHRLDGRLVPIAMDRFKTSPPLGVYSLAGITRAYGYEVEVLDLIAEGGLDEKTIISRSGQADVVGISANSLNWPSAKLAVDLVKSAHPSLPVVLGGIHPTSFPDHVLASCGVDFLVQGEGEASLPLLMRALSGGLSFAAVPGLVWRKGESVVKNGNAVLTVEDLTNLPDPAYDLLPSGCYESLSVESSRGCRFNCSFCSTKFRGSWRAVDANSFVDRLERLESYLDKTVYQAFNFVDDLFTFDPNRVIEIAQLIEQRNLDVWATLDGRVTDMIRPGVAEALVPITSQMLVGAECGYNEGLKKIRKGTSTGIIERAAKVLQDVGLSHRTVFSFVIGFPFETKSDCLKTIHFASELMRKYNVRIYLQWFNAIPGSDMWDHLRESGELDISLYDEFGFLTNERIFRKAVPLSIEELKELSAIIRDINTLFLLTKPASDLIQFSPPEWLHAPTLDFPSKGTLPPDARTQTNQ